ncbi:16536_t:CDS:2 [Acaulospora colombiana]|uniref:16536_t:CDS:1 n=1 Tax=Acaulospora colombiana TaxID=27376 RepID=A0ACA9MJ88_9GLOM|nr:16536_t:CDS:2 [Acaulospora colombiana]
MTWTSSLARNQAEGVGESLHSLDVSATLRIQCASQPSGRCCINTPLTVISTSGTCNKVASSLSGQKAVELLEGLLRVTAEGHKLRCKPNNDIHPFLLPSPHPRWVAYYTVAALSLAEAPFPSFTLHPSSNSHCTLQAFRKMENSKHGSLPLLDKVLGLDVDNAVIGFTRMLLRVTKWAALLAKSPPNLLWYRHLFEPRTIERRAREGAKPPVQEKSLWP